MRLPLPRRKRSGRSLAREGDPAAIRPEADGTLPIANYEQLSVKEITGGLHLLSQVDLGIIEEHERSNGKRVPVLTKLAYMREEEPLNGYDGLDAAEVVRILADANAETVRTIRDYERKFQHRREISEAVARVLPKARPSDREDRQEADRAARITAGHRSRAAAGERLQDARSDSGAQSVEP